MSWQDLFSSDATIAAWSADMPTEILPFFNEVAMNEVVSDRAFRYYTRIHKEIRVCIVELPVSVSLRQLR